MGDVKEYILQETKNGNIVIFSEMGLITFSLEEFIKQDVDSILYDLNRNEPVILSFLDDPKWINDYATAQVIRALKK